MGNFVSIFITAQLSRSPFKLQENWMHFLALQSFGECSLPRLLSTRKAQRTVVLLVPLSYLDFIPKSGPSRGYSGLTTNKQIIFPSTQLLLGLPDAVYPLIPFPRFSNERTALETQQK